MPSAVTDTNGWPTTSRIVRATRDDRCLTIVTRIEAAQRLRRREDVGHVAFDVGSLRLKDHIDAHPESVTRATYKPSYPSR
jgi:hypothetical protein